MNQLPPDIMAPPPNSPPKLVWTPPVPIAWARGNGNASVDKASCCSCGEEVPLKNIMPLEQLIVTCFILCPMCAKKTSTERQAKAKSKAEEKAKEKDLTELMEDLVIQQQIRKDSKKESKLRTREMTLESNSTSTSSS